MDNPHIDILARDRITFDLAMKLAFHLNGANTTAKFWVVQGPELFAGNYEGPPAIRGSLGGPILILLWNAEDHGAEASHPFPAPLKDEGAAEMAWNWLQSQDVPPPEREMQASTVRAWRVFNTDWGHIGPYHYGFVAVQVAHAWIGK